MSGKMTLYKLVVLGDGGVGKTALTIQLCLNHFVETYDPTIEDSYRKQVVIDGQSCMLEVLDTAGQEEYRALRDQWIRDGEGYVLVYSITSRESFRRVQQFHRQVQRVKDSSATSPIGPGSLGMLSSPMSPHPPQITGPPPIMLVGNKSDRIAEREVSTQEGQALARELNCDFVEASAKNNMNVDRAFYDVVRRLRRQRQEHANGQATGGGSGSKSTKSGSSTKKPRTHSKRGDSDMNGTIKGESRSGRMRRPESSRRTGKCVIL